MLSLPLPRFLSSLNLRAETWRTEYSDSEAWHCGREFDTNHVSIEAEFFRAFDGSASSSSLLPSEVSSALHTWTRFSSKPARRALNHFTRPVATTRRPPARIATSAKKASKKGQAGIRWLLLSKGGDGDVHELGMWRACFVGSGATGTMIGGSAVVTVVVDAKLVLLLLLVSVVLV